MTGRARKFIRLILIFILILSAVLACYHRLLLRGPEGKLQYTAIRWGMKEFMYPRLIFNSDSIRDGIWPLWNPYQFGGSPWVSNFQAGIFHPLNLLIIIVAGYSAAALQIQLVLIFFLAGVAMYFCLREFGGGIEASLLGAICFLGCGFFVGNASYFPQINTLAIFPLVFLFSLRTVRSYGWGAIAGGAFSTAVMIFSGFPTMAFFLAAFAGMYGLFDIWFVRCLPASEAWGNSLRLGVMFAAALGLSAVLLFPALESYPLITRPDRIPGSALSLPPEIVQEKSLPPGNLLSLFFPSLGCRHLSGYKLWIEFRNCSVGLIGFLFAVYYFIFRRGRERWLLLFMFLSTVFFSLGMNTPIYKLLYRWCLPFGMVSHPAMDFRAIFLFFLCLSAGLGLDEFLRNRSGSTGRLRSVLLGVIAVGVVLLALGSRVLEFSLREVLKDSLPGLIIIGVMGVLISLKKLLGRYLGWSLIVLAVLDMAWWVNFNFQTVAEPVSPSRREKRVGKEAARSMEVTSHDDFKRKRQYPGRAGVKSMFWKYFSDSGNDGTRLKNFQEVMETPGSLLLSEDFRVMPIYAVKVLDSPGEVLAEINRGTDLRRVGLIQREDITAPGLESKLKALRSPEKMGEKFRGEITYFSPNEIHYQLDLLTPALIFFNEIYYPGWRLGEGGDELPLFELNHAFRGTCLEAGEHNLVMWFAPRSYYLGLLTSGVTFLLLLGAVIRKRRRKINLIE